MKIAEIEFDGGCSANGSKKATGTFGYILKFDGREYQGSGAVTGDVVTNNVAEYTALLKALQKFREVVKNPELCEVMIYGDSRLVVETVGKRWGWSPAKVVWNPHKQQPHLQELLYAVLELLEGLNYQTVWVRREKNKRADALTRK
jgi:ribonuclease HI